MVRQSGLLLVLMVGAVPASADVPDAEMVRCASIVADQDRLACYDAVTERISGASQIVGKRRAEAAEAKRKADEAAAEAARVAALKAQEQKVGTFGAETTARRDDLSDDRLDEINAKVSEAFTDQFGRYVILLDNGQLWKQLDGKLLTPRAGDDVTLERAALGSYELKILRQKRKVKVKRLK